MPQPRVTHANRCARRARRYRQWLLGGSALMPRWPPLTATEQSATLILVEHADLVTEIDLGEPGPSVGDMLVWGPNALYDEADANDTGATTQGTCIAFNAAADCLAAETILFPDGSTLEFQGIERALARHRRGPSSAAQGAISGAIGTMMAVPSAALLLWTKTIEIAPPSGRP